jgi:hypothetical protein
MSIDFSKYTYEDISICRSKMKVLDEMLPNLNDLEMNWAHKNEHDKVGQDSVDKILEERSRFTLTEIV